MRVLAGLVLTVCVLCMFIIFGPAMKRHNEHIKMCQKKCEPHVFKREYLDKCECDLSRTVR